MEAGILLIFGRIPALFSGLPAVGSGRKDERKHTSECFLSLFFYYKLYKIFPIHLDK